MAAPRRLLVLAVAAAVAGLSGCAHDRSRPDSLRAWLETPPAHGPSQRADPADRVRFLPCVSFDHRRDRAVAAPMLAELQAGDVVAYRMDRWSARWRLLTGHLQDVTFDLFTYGHIAVVVEDPPGRRYLLTSETATGSVREELSELSTYDWDAFRLDQDGRLDRARLAEFARVCQQRGHGWLGYDYAGLLGFGDRNLQPACADEIGRRYLCSTVVVAAYRYAGIALDAGRAQGPGHVCPPAVVVASAGAVVAVPPAMLAHAEAPAPAEPGAVSALAVAPAAPHAGGDAHAP
jgi:hypothetical protein